MKIILGILAAMSFIAATLVSVFASKLESPITHLWAKLLGKPLSGKKPTRRSIIIWIGFLIFLCLGAASAALVQTIPSQDMELSPVITMISPSTNGQITNSMADFSPIIEEFSSNEGFTQTSSRVFIDGDQVNCNISRSAGEQFVYRSIPDISGDFRFTVIGSVNSWTNNCNCNVGIGDAVNNGIFISFGWFGGGCPENGPTIFPGGGISKTFEHNCLMDDNWPWFEKGIPYRVSLEVKGIHSTLYVEDQQVEKFFGTNSYTGKYNTLWIGRDDKNDWPECSITIESVTIEPID